MYFEFLHIISKFVPGASEHPILLYDPIKDESHNNENYAAVVSIVKVDFNYSRLAALNKALGI